MSTYECRFCGQVFTTMPNGGCSKCGAPGVKEVILEARSYSPPSASSSNVTSTSYPENNQQVYRYVQPGPLKRAQHSFFRTFGFRVGMFVLAVPLIVFIGITAYWFFYTGTPTPDSNPELRGAYPTLMVTPTTRPTENPFDDFDWYSAEEAQLLRSKENVVNFGLLRNGSVSYSIQFSVKFDESIWTVANRPPGFSQLTVSGTAASFNVNGKNYVLNVYQPFVVEGSYKVVYLVNPLGNLWVIPTEKARFEPIEDVVVFLPVTVSPNQQLSFTH